MLRKDCHYRKEMRMKAVVYKGNGQIVLEERPMPALRDEKDAIV